MSGGQRTQKCLSLLDATGWSPHLGTFWHALVLVPWMHLSLCWQCSCHLLFWLMIVSLSGLEDLSRCAMLSLQEVPTGMCRRKCCYPCVGALCSFTVIFGTDFQLSFWMCLSQGPRSSTFRNDWHVTLLGPNLLKTSLA